MAVKARRKPVSTALERLQQWREQNRDYVNAQEAARRDTLASQGLCVQCRRKNPDVSRRRCPRCAKAARASAKALRAARGGS